MNLYVKVDSKSLLPDSLKPWADFANFCQHRILVGKMYWQAKESGFVPLKKRYLETVIHPRRLKPILDALFKLGIIERDGRWQEGKESIGYRFTAAFAALPTIRVACHSQRIAKRLVKAQNSTDRMTTFTKVHRHLRRNLRHITLDLETALRLDKDSEQGDLIRYISNGDAQDLSVCDYGRVHTAITRLLRPVREKLCYQGQPMVEVDISNSQPLFLVSYIQTEVAKLSEPSHRRKQACLSKLGFSRSGLAKAEGSTVASSGASNSQSCLPSSCSHVLHDHHILEMSLRDKDLSPFCALPENLADFISLVEAGRLYETLMAWMGWKGSKDEFKDQELFAMLYGPVKDSRLSRAMAEHFPHVWAFMVWHKGRFGYKALSREMQKAESRLMIESVCGRLMTEHPDCPLVTIHDSIMTTEPWVETVKAAIRAEFAKIGLSPTLKTKGEPPAVKPHVALTCPPQPFWAPDPARGSPPEPPAAHQPSWSQKAK